MNINKFSSYVSRPQIYLKYVEFTVSIHCSDLPSVIIDQASKQAVPSSAASYQASKKESNNPSSKQLSLSRPS